MRKLLILFLSFILLSACQEGEKVIMSTYPDGTPMTIGYYRWYGNDKILIKEVTYFSDGTKKIEGYYDEKGRKDGRWLYWFENGKKWLEENYKNGIRDGKFIEWYKSGYKNFSGNYKNGLPDGEWIFWDETGNKVKKVIYEKGDKIEEYTY